MFVAWPNLAKSLDVKPGPVTVVIVIMTLVAVTFADPGGIAGVKTISLKALVVIVVVGVFNGAAVYLYAATSADKAIPTSVFLGTIFVLQVLTAILFDRVLNGQQLSREQFCGLFLAIPTLWLLAQRSPSIT